MSESEKFEEVLSVEAEGIQDRPVFAVSSAHYDASSVRPPRKSLPTNNVGDYSYDTD